jgi:hypothetical protein
VGRKAQRDTAADVVGDEGDRRLVEPFEQRPEHRLLCADRAVESLAAGGVAVPQQVGNDDAVVVLEGRGDVAPQVRPRRDAVQEDERLAVGRSLVAVRHGQLVAVDGDGRLRLCGAPGLVVHITRSEMMFFWISLVPS